MVQVGKLYIKLIPTRSQTYVASHQRDYNGQPEML